MKYGYEHGYAQGQEEGRMMVGLMGSQEEGRMPVGLMGSQEEGRMTVGLMGSPSSAFSNEKAHLRGGS